MPDLVVIAGPNGAGKSSSEPRLVGERFAIKEFVNADVIASGLSAHAPERVAIEAGRVMLRRLEELATSSASFAFETTLASRSFAPWIARQKRERGYRFHLVFLWLPDPEESVRRVARRVQRGGHHVPPEIVRRRYARGILNFLHLYRPIADTWTLYDNSTEARLVAYRAPGGPEVRLDVEAWNRMEKSVEAREDELAYAVPGTVPGIMGVPLDEVTAILREGARDARRLHKALGVPIVIWRDGRVVEIPPEEIVV